MNVRPHEEPAEQVPASATQRVVLHDFALGKFDAKGPHGTSRWPHFDLFWVHEGRLRLRFLPAREEVLRAGEGVLIYPDTEFSIFAVAKVSRASVHHFEIKGAERRDELPLPLRRLLERRQGYELYQPREKKEIQTALARSLEWTSCRQTAMVTELRVAQFTAVLAELALGPRQLQATDVVDAAFARLVDELRVKLAEPMPLRAMAGRVGMSVSHFRARFRELYRVSPGFYLLRARMIEATNLLSQTTLPLKAIARQTGYGQVTAFYRAFRAKMGMTPTEYRRRYAARR